MTDTARPPTKRRFTLRADEMENVFFRRLYLSTLAPVILLITAILCSVLAAYDEFADNFKNAIRGYRRYW